jgi:hypothetical protein
MTRRFFSLWGGLPDFFALAAMVWCLGYGLTMGIVGANIGRQSSTFALGVFLPIIAAPLLGAVGLLVGRLAASVVGARVPGRWVRVLKLSAPLVLVAIAIVAAWQASGPLYAAERAARPRVIQNSAQLHKRTGSLSADGMEPGSRVYDRLKKINKTTQWGTGSAHLVNRGDVLEVRFVPDGAALLIPLPGIDYITHVDAMPLRLGAGARPALALLITGRATGRRDLIAVISESRELVYLELLERFWNAGFWNATVPLAIKPAAAGDLILVGSEPHNLLVFAPPDSV